MGFKAKHITYSQTGSFSKIVTDYLANVPALQPFYSFSPDINGIRKAIAARKQFKTDRTLLVNELRKQYTNAVTAEKVNANIDALLDENTFTICTAHQPNIFTGHLYFIYKILHAIRLAEDLKKEIPGSNFVPVYYMGSEDADLAELGEVSIDGTVYKWQTGQKGAVGRMKIDKAFISLIGEIENRLSVEPYGNEIIHLVRKCYAQDKTVSEATFEFVHELFAGYGLVILLPDNAVLKKTFHIVNQKELTEQFSHKLVGDTIARFPHEYKVQAAGREINLFYLKDDLRERISREGSKFKVKDTSISFDEAEMNAELENFPERFSQNVILRPVFQEMILPGVAFIGGGGELAYWLELKKVFEAVDVPFPVLVLRNSFMLVPQKVAEKMAALKLNVSDFFKPLKTITNGLVKRDSVLQVQLEKEKLALLDVYEKMGKAAGNIDITLQKHTEALMHKSLKRVEVLEMKMLKAEKKKFEAQQRQIQKIKESLFPSGTLQERVDNLLYHYAVWGRSFIDQLYKYSTGLKQEFCILEEKKV